MANVFFDPGGQRAARVRDLFARIAPRYDRINDLQSFGLHRLWKRRVLRLAAPAPGVRALDACCGTGDIALALAARGAETVGLDFSAEMLQVAARRMARRQSAGGAETPRAAGFRLRFMRGDALHMPFETGRFEIVTVGYGLRNLADLKAGLSEMARVAAPGGRLVALDFGQPDNRVWRGIYYGYLRLIVPVLGRVFCGNAAAYAYILESLKHYPGQNGVAALMRELGLVNVRVVNLLGGLMSLNYGEKAPEL